MLPDYHIHTYLCKHASGSPEEYVKTALKNNLPEIGFSDHCPYPIGYDIKFRMNPDQFALYREIVFELKAKFKQPKIKYALEIDWVPNQMQEVFEKIKNENFDYIVGSVHYTDNFPFDNPEVEEVWQKNDIADTVWTRYMQLLLEMVKSEKFNIIGHFDLPKKFGYYPKDMERIKLLAKEVLVAAADTKTAIEINTSGLRKKVREIYPSADFLSLAKKYGVNICFGSDAHSPEEVGADFDKALSLAKFAGYTKFCTFSDRKLTLLPLP